MKRFFTFMFLVGLLSSCNTEPENPIEMDLTVRLLGNPQCNGQKSAEVYAETLNSESCVEFVFDKEARKLAIKHLNADFNCCPESLYCTIVYRNDSIIIQEFEKHMGCKCNCLYNLDLEINGVEPGKYQLRLIEPYLGTQQPLIGLLDLQTQKQGGFCVSRSNYPWGE